MILTTTGGVEGHRMTRLSRNRGRRGDRGRERRPRLLRPITDVVGGRSDAYQSKLQDARETALRELEQRASQVGADAVVGIDLDYEVVGESMLMVSDSGTAVTIAAA